MIIKSQNLDFNLGYIKQHTTKKICAVVKANAYGHGLEKIVTLLKNKVDFFACANLSEGINLRNYDQTTPTLILFDCDNYAIAEKNNLSVCIHTLEQAKSIPQKSNLKVHIAFNCGMNRFGFDSLKKLKKIYKILQSKCIIEGIYTHFNTICSDTKIYAKQIQKFDEIVNYFKQKNPNIIFHSGGSHDLINAKYDMLRVGIFLYGYGQNNLKPVMKIFSPILQINFLRKGDICGYDKEFIAQQDCYIAVLPIGYQDGIKKYFFGQACTLENYICPIVSVCMDCIMIKIPKNAKIGQYVCVFDNADKLCNQLNYEILTSFNGFRGVKVVE